MKNLLKTVLIPTLASVILSGTLTSCNQAENEIKNVRFTYLTQPVDDLESMSVTGISNEQELFAYLDDVATYWCSEWQKAKQYQNANRRYEEMLKVDRCINAYPTGIQEGLIMLNDLPMELNSKAREHFQNKVKELGFDPNWDEYTTKEKSGDIDDGNESIETGRNRELDEDEYNRQQEEAERQSNIAYYNSNSIIEKVMTFVECGCGAHDCAIVFQDEEGNVHEFIQSVITEYDFGCPRNVRYLNRKFRIKYELGEMGYEELISISLL
jgi:hypothetical protein